MKKKYRIRNWPEYNRALCQRGSLNLWFSSESLAKWHNPPHNYRSARPLHYSNDAILTILLIRLVYHLPLRALSGFLLSIVQLLRLTIDVPSYSQICRRAKLLEKQLKRLSHKRPTDIVFDSTGLKVYGEGEWKVRQHGSSKRRSWRKLHIALDPDSGEILIAEMTPSDEADAQVAKKMVSRLPGSINCGYGDGAYDGRPFRDELAKRGIAEVIPPPRNGRVHRDLDGLRAERNNAIKEIQGLGGDEEARKLWKRLKGYHKRSLVETAMFRIKQLTGEKLRSRKTESSRTECLVKCLIVNKMTRLGMPRGEWQEVA